MSRHANLNYCMYWVRPLKKITTARALNLLRVIEKSDEISQRQLADQIDISLGTANQTVRALVAEGLLDTEFVTTSKGKRGQNYRLTETGKQERKALVQRRILECEQQIDALNAEITALKAEL